MNKKYTYLLSVSGILLWSLVFSGHVTAAVEVDFEARIASAKSLALGKLTQKFVSATGTTDGIPVIIQFRDGKENDAESSKGVGSIRKSPATVQRHILTSLARGSYTEVRAYDHLPLAAMRVTQASLERLAANPDIIGIYENKRRHISLSESVPQVKADNVFNRGFIGEGQVVAVVDNGVDRDHPMLAGKVVAEGCFSTNDTYSSSVCPGGNERENGSYSADVSGDDSEHGTHVAGIAAGVKGDDYVNGVAPGAQIIAVRVDSESIFGNTMYDSDILAGIDYVYGLRQKFRIASVNLSLGGDEFFTSYCDSSVYKPVFDKLRSAGIAPVVASGNEDKTNSLSEPACVSSAISVGAVTKHDQVWSGSNSSNFLDLLAPGVSIVSSFIYDDSLPPEDNLTSSTGTSMATPHVAGAFALLKSIKPEASVEELETALKESGKMIVDSRNNIVKPRIDLEEAMYLVDPSLKKKPQKSFNILSGAFYLLGRRKSN